MNTHLAAACAGYIIGSVPFGYLAGRVAGVDVRTCGSGNVGATNVVRVLGKKFGYSVFLLDFAKGLAAVFCARWLSNRAALDSAGAEVATAFAGIAAVIGHSFPIWLKFRGGKGVATCIGALFGLVPIAAVIVCVVWLVTFEIGRYVSLASVVAAVALPIAVGVMFLLHRFDSPVFVYLAVCLACLVLIRHRSNLARLANGTEPRFDRK